MLLDNYFVCVNFKVCQQAMIVSAMNTFSNTNIACTTPVR